MQRKALSLVGLATVLAAAYWFDLYVLPPLRRAAGINFDPAPAAWTVLVADIAIALAVLGLVWMLFRWAPPSRVVGAIYLVVGFLLAAAWPIAVATVNHTVSIPGFAELNLYLALQQPYSLLALIAPFIVALGLLRLVLPLPGRGRSSDVRRSAPGDATDRP